jgi:hypothetical protein
MSKVFYIDKYTREALFKISLEFSKAKKRLIRNLVMVVISLIAASIAQISTKDPNLSFFFSTGIFICLILLIVILKSLFRISKSRRSLFQLKLNIDKFEDYIFIQSFGIREKTLIGVRDQFLICITSESIDGDFFTVIGNKESIHMSQVRIQDEDRRNFTETLTNNHFIEINENW